MDKNELISNFIDKHDSWFMSCCRNITGDIDTAKDLYQDTIVKLLDLPDTRFEKIRYGAQDLNTYFVYTVAKNLFINAVKKNKEDIIEEDDYDTIFKEQEDDSIPLYKEEKLNSLLDDIDAFLDDMEKDSVLWFSARLFRVYLDEGHTYDSLAAKTGISRSTIFTSIKNIRRHLEEVFGDEYRCVDEDEL